MQAAQNRRENPIPGSFGQDLMEFDISLDELPAIAGLFHLHDQIVQLHQLFGGGEAGSLPGVVLFDYEASLEQLAQGDRLEAQHLPEEIRNHIATAVADEDPDTRALLDQPALLQRGQRVANHCAAHAEALGQLAAAANAIARLQPLILDDALDLAGDTIAQ